MQENFQQFNDPFFISDPVRNDDPAPAAEPSGPPEYEFRARENLEKWAPIITLILTILIFIKGN